MHINKVNTSIISYLTHCDAWVYHYEDNQTDDDDFLNDGEFDNDNAYDNNNNVFNMEKGNL